MIGRVVGAIVWQPDGQEVGDDACNVCVCVGMLK